MTAIDHIRLSQQAKDQLIKLKRVTGIEHWNVLCRWALCVSLAESSIPPAAKIPSDSNVEMSWKVFGGRHTDLYLALVKERCLVTGSLPIPKPSHSSFAFICIGAFRTSLQTRASAGSMI